MIVKINGLYIFIVIMLFIMGILLPIVMEDGVAIGQWIYWKIKNH